MSVAEWTKKTASELFRSRARAVGVEAVLPVHRLVEWFLRAKPVPERCAECGIATQGEEFCSFVCSALAFERHH